jgi:hypothetical protein
MKIIRKFFITLLGALFVLLGLVFIIVPGPSILLLVPGLFLLSLEYPVAKTWLRKYMRLMRTAAQWIDKKLLHKKYG